MELRHGHAEPLVDARERPLEPPRPEHDGAGPGAALAGFPRSQQARELADVPRLRLAKVAERLDFFTTSSCRDLLFHVREYQYTLPEIDKFIRQNQLDFLGFHLPGSVLQNFRERFPTARTMTNLALWHDFEMETHLLSRACTNSGYERRNRA